MSTEREAMSSNPLPPSLLTVPEKHELAEMKRDWWWFLLLGILLIVLGVIALSCPIAFSVVAVEIFGILLVIGGVAQIITTFWEAKWRGFFLHLLSGILYVVVGGLILRQPVKGLEVLTLLLVAFFIVQGLFRIILAMQLKFHQWGWCLLSGLVSLFLGIFIWCEWPAISILVIAIFLGIEMIFNGVTWVMLSTDIRNADPA